MSPGLLSHRVGCLLLLGFQGPEPMEKWSRVLCTNLGHLSTSKWKHGSSPACRCTPWVRMWQWDMLAVGISYRKFLWHVSASRKPPWSFPCLKRYSLSQGAAARYTHHGVPVCKLPRAGKFPWHAISKQISSHLSHHKLWLPLFVATFLGNLECNKGLGHLFIYNLCFHKGDGCLYLKSSPSHLTLRSYC